MSKLIINVSFELRAELDYPVESYPVNHEKALESYGENIDCFCNDIKKHLEKIGGFDIKRLKRLEIRRV